MATFIKDSFCSITAAGLPGFQHIAELSARACVPPKGFTNPFTDIQPTDHLYQLREDLAHAPDPAKYMPVEFRDAATAVRRRHGLIKAQAGNVTGADSFRLGRGYVDLGADDPALSELATAVADYFGRECPIQGHFYYPPGGFREWHTNRFNPPGWRMYLVSVDVPRASYFRFQHPLSREIHTLWDEPDTVNFFRIDPDEPLWHCIQSVSANRWSKGFIVGADWIERLA